MNDDTTPAPVDAEAGEPESAAEAAKIARFEKLVEVPTTYKAEYERFGEDRDYVAVDCVAEKDDRDTVLTNYILRNQRVLISQTYARDPAISVNPVQWMGPMPPGHAEFAQTVELLVPRLAEEADFKPVLTGVLQDVQTYGIAWLKVGLQVDPERDAIGLRRQDDQLDNIARYRVLMDRFEAEEFGEDEADYQELLDLGDTVRVYLRDQLMADLEKQPPQQVPTGAVDPLTGAPGMMQDPEDPRYAQLEQIQQFGKPIEASFVPEVPQFLGATLDPIQPEDVRFDWDITRPEDLYHGRWWAHRVYLTGAQISERWSSVKTADLAKIPADKNVSGEGQTENPQDREDLESTTLNRRHAVWELWDRDSGRRYVWVQGMRRFLVNEIPTVTWRRFFPFVCLIFNRITGKVIPISDVRLQMPHQDEINQKRTHEREAQKAAYPKYIVGKGLISSDEKSKLEDATPYAVVEIEKADDVQKSLKELATSKFDPILYDTSKAEREMEYVSGVSKNAAGQTGGSDTATEAAIANEQMGIQSDFRKSAVECFIQEVYTAIADMAVVAFPEINVKMMCGPAAVWPGLDRQNLWRSMNLKIRAGSAGKPDKRQQMELWTQFAGLAAQYGLVPNGIEVFKQLLHEMELPVDLGRFILDPMLVMQAQAQGIALPGSAPPGAAGTPKGAGAPPGAGAPNNPQAGPGAPPMANRGGVPRPSQVPNSPAAKGGVAGPPGQ